MTWSIDPSVFANVVEADLARLRTRISLELMRSVVLKTPVDEGRARGSWSLSYSVDIPIDMVRGAGQTIVANTQNLAQRASSPYEKVIILNNLPYIRRLEFGYSKQAPNGMMRLSVAAIRSRYQ